MKTFRLFVSVLTMALFYVSCGDDEKEESTELSFPIVYHIKAFTEEVDLSTYSMGTTLKERTIKGTITITKNHIDYSFKPEDNGGHITMDYTVPVTSIDYKKKCFYNGEDKGFITYEYTLKDGRKVIIDECPEDDVISYWVIDYKE